MEVVEITQGGVIDPEDVLWLGGSYGWLIRIRRGGVGSPKMVYELGVPAFDQLSHGVAGQTTFVNFELMVDGLLLRANCTQRLAAVGIRYEDISSIEMVAKPQLVKRRSVKFLRLAHQTVYEGVITLRTKSNQTVILRTRTSEFEAVKIFFEGALELQHLVSFRTDTLPGTDVLT